MTVKGSPTIEVDGTNAQITAGNFVDLVQRVCDADVSSGCPATATFVVQGRSASKTRTSHHRVWEPAVLLTQRQVLAIFLWKLSLQGASSDLQSNAGSDNISDPPVLQHTWCSGDGAIATA